MGNFFKGIGKGLFNIVIIPFFLIGLALSSVVGIGVFFMEFIKKIGRFFTGKKLSTDLPEDEQAKRMIAEANGEKQKGGIEIVQAEIADPIANYREMAKACATAKAVDSKEDVDMFVDDVPFEFDVSMEEERKASTPIDDKKNESNNETNAIEQYKPKGSNF